MIHETDPVVYEKKLLIEDQTAPGRNFHNESIIQTLR